MTWLNAMRGARDLRRVARELVRQTTRVACAHRASRASDDAGSRFNSNAGVAELQGVGAAGVATSTRPSAASNADVVGLQGAGAATVAESTRPQCWAAGPATRVSQGGRSGGQCPSRGGLHARWCGRPGGEQARECGQQRGCRRVGLQDAGAAASASGLRTRGTRRERHARGRPREMRQ